MNTHKRLQRTMLEEEKKSAAQKHARKKRNRKQCQFQQNRQKLKPDKMNQTCFVCGL